MAFGWGDLLIWGLGVAATGFSIWYTAKRTVQTSVQQKVWGEVYEAKSTAVVEFSEALIAFAESLSDFMNLDLGHRESNLALSFGRAKGVLTTRFGTESTDVVVKRLMNMMPSDAMIAKGGKAVEERRDKFYEELQAICIVDLDKAVDQIKTRYSRLSLLAKDPLVPRRSYKFAINIFNEIGTPPRGYERLDYPKTMQRWNDVNGIVRLRLRQDLGESVASLPAALAYSDEWRAYMETPGSMRSDDADLMPVLKPGVQPRPT